MGNLNRKTSTKFKLLKAWLSIQCVFALDYKKESIRGRIIGIQHILNYLKTKDAKLLIEAKDLAENNYKKELEKGIFERETDRFVAIWGEIRLFLVNENKY